MTTPLPDSTKINIPMRVTGSYFGSNRVFAYRNQRDRIGHIDRPRNLFEKMTSTLYAPFGGRPYIGNTGWAEFFDDKNKTRTRNYPIVLDKISDWFPKRLSGNNFPGEGYSIVLDYDWVPPGNNPTNCAENQVVFSPSNGARYCLPIVSFNKIKRNFTFKLQKRNLWGSPWVDVYTQAVAFADGENQIFRFDMITLDDASKVPFFELNLNVPGGTSDAASFEFIDEVSAIWNNALLVKNVGYGDGWVENKLTPSDDSFWINNTYNGSYTTVESSRNIWDNDRENDFTVQMQKKYYNPEGNIGFITTANRVNRAGQLLKGYQAACDWYIFPPHEPVPFDPPDPFAGNIDHNKHNIYLGPWGNACISGNDLMVSYTVPQKIGIDDPSEDIKGWQFQTPIRLDGNIDKITFYHHSYGYVQDYSTPYPYEWVENRPRAKSALLGYTNVLPPNRNINNPKYPPQSDPTWVLLGKISLPYTWYDTGTLDRDGTRTVWDVSSLIGLGVKEQHTGLQYKEYWLVVEETVQPVPPLDPYDVENSMSSVCYIFGDRSIGEQYPYTIAGGYKLVDGEQVYDPNHLLKGAIKSPEVSPSTQLTAIDDKDDRRVELEGLGPHTFPIVYEDEFWYGSNIYRCKLPNTEYKFYKATKTWRGSNYAAGFSNYPFGTGYNVAGVSTVLCRPGEVVYGGYEDGDSLHPTEHETIVFQEVDVSSFINNPPTIGTETAPISAYTTLTKFVNNEGIFGTTLLDVGISGTYLFEGLFSGYDGSSGNKVYITEDKNTYPIPINDPNATKYVFDFADNFYGVNIGDPTKAEKLQYGAPLYWKGNYYTCSDLDLGYVKTREDVPKNCKYLPYQIRVWKEEEEEWDNSTYIRKGIVKNGVPYTDSPHFSFTVTSDTPKTIRLMFHPTLAYVGTGYFYSPNSIRLRINKI